MKPVRLMSFAFLGATLVGSIPWTGIWPLPLLGIALVGFLGIDRALPRARRPEYLVAGAWLLSVLMITAACLKFGGVTSPALPWLAIPAVTLTARFRPAVVVVGAVLTGLTTIAIALAVRPLATIHDPMPVLFDLALVASVVSFTLALMKSELEHRADALIDPLTGMLNRHALRGRIAELSAQAKIGHEPIALILADLDHFKSINDEWGHDTGDLVLVETASRMRQQLRAYDFAYRIGGEEFLVMVPGADLATARSVAESLRQAIANGPIAGIDTTISLGVSAATARDFDYDRLFAQADRALYAAKHNGRNSVTAIGSEQAAEPSPRACVEHPGYAASAA